MGNKNISPECEVCAAPAISSVLDIEMDEEGKWSPLDQHYFCEEHDRPSVSIVPNNAARLEIDAGWRSLSRQFAVLGRPLFRMPEIKVKGE